MPVMVRRLGKKFRLIDSETMRIAKNKAGKAIDSGGFLFKYEATQQAKAVNASLHKAGKI